MEVGCLKQVVSILFNQCTKLSGNFIYCHWGCKLIYRPLSYPFRSLYHCPCFLEGEIGRKIMILIGRKIMSKKRDLWVLMAFQLGLWLLLRLVHR